jgi:hypothetical protein
MAHKGTMLVIVKEDYDAMSRETAGVVAEHLRKKPNLVLGKPPRRNVYLRHRSVSYVGLQGLASRTEEWYIFVAQRFSRYVLIQIFFTEPP